MPGENCSIFGCGSCRRHKGLSFTRIPKDDIFTREYREKILSVITRDRVVDEKFAEQILHDKVWVCEKHFHPDEFYIYPTRKKLKEGVIPTLLLGKKHIQPTPRSTSVIEKRELAFQQQQDLISQKPVVAYKSFTEFIERILKQKLTVGWNVLPQEQHVVISFTESGYVTPKYQIYVDSNLNFLLRFYEWVVPKDHKVHTEFSQCFSNVSLSNFILFLKRFHECQGITLPNEDCLLDTVKHIIVKKFDFSKFNSSEKSDPYSHDAFYRSRGCLLLLDADHKFTSCEPCSKLNIKLKSQQNWKKSQKCLPIKPKAPITITSPDRLKVTIQTSRLQCNQFKREIENMREALKKVETTVDKELGEDLKTIFSSCDSSKIPPFMKLFWEEQQKYSQVKNAKSLRYHPMIIKFCLSLAAKSPSAYEHMRLNSKTGTGVLVLPSQRLLRDYRNYITPTRGFNQKVIEELTKKVANFSDIERFIVLMFDEMKVQEDLVWDKNTGELVGFVDLGDPDVNYGALPSVTEIASHILVFLIKSLANPLSYSFATFATTGATSGQIYPLFWRAVAILEMTCKLKVVACTCDGASPNRRFFRMHKVYSDDSPSITHQVINRYANDKRSIYFFSDAPHLMKTARNCWLNSGSGKATRFLWNDGDYILWSHLTRIYHENLNCGLQMLPHMKYEHIHLTPYSKMNVRLAVQVLSERVATTMLCTDPVEFSGTAKFCIMMDQFFDCMNVRNSQEGIRKRKEFLQPYKYINDQRFQWLDEFLQYLHQWRESTLQRPGKFTATARDSMFISMQTYEGLQISSLSLKGLVPYLLSNGMKFVLSEKLCQDDLENYFGKQRSIGRRKDNPTVRDAGYGDNIIKSQFSIQPNKTNSRPGSSKWNDISDEPLPRKRKKK